MRIPILALFLACSNLAAAQGSPPSRDIGASPGEATVFAYNGAGINLDTLTADPVVVGRDWTLKLTPQAGRAPGTWLVRLRSAEAAGTVLDLGDRFGQPLAGRSELLVNPGAFLADIAAGAHGGAGTTATLRVPVPYDHALVGLEWFAQALVLGDLPHTGGIRTLNLDGATDFPWSEQGFTFFADDSMTQIAGGALRQWTSGGFFYFNIVELRREDGGRFDLLSVDVDYVYLPSGWHGSSWANLQTPDESAYLELYQEGTVVPIGPEWQGLQSLWILVVRGTLTTDDFVVDMGPPAGAGLLDPWFSSAVGGAVGSF